MKIGETMIGLSRFLPFRLTIEAGEPWPAPMPPPPGLQVGLERTYILVEDAPDSRPLRPVPDDLDVYRLAPELRGQGTELGRLRRMQDPYRVCIRVGSLAERQGYREHQSTQRPGACGVVFWRATGEPDAFIYGEGPTRAEAYIDAVRQIYGWEEDPRDVHVGPRGDEYVYEAD